MWRFGLEVALRLFLGLLGAIVLAGAVASLSAGRDAGLFASVASYLLSLLHMDFGHSRLTGLAAESELLARLPATAELLMTGALISLVLGVPSGLLFSSNKTLRPVGAIPQILEALPPFIICVALVWASEFWHWPLATQGPPPAPGLLPTDGFDVGSELQALALPALVVGLVGTVVVQMRIRRAAREAAKVPYREGLQRLGLPAWEIWLRFVAPVVVAGLFAGLGEIVVALISADLVAEWVFGWPGIGALFIKSVALSDWPVVALIALTFAALKLLAEFLGLLAARAFALGGYA